MLSQSQYHFYSIPAWSQFIARSGGNWLQTPLVSQVAINNFDTFGSKYTPPISHFDLLAVLVLYAFGE